MAFGTVQADVIGTSVAGSSLGAGNASIMKNRIINGAMVIDQRNAGASVTPTTTGYTLDRWTFFITQASKASIQQVNTSIVGFSKSLKVTSLSAYSINSTDRFQLTQPIEGFNIADLGWGTANAKTVTLSFVVNSSLTGTFGGCINNGIADRSYIFSYSIPVANTDTKISITITGDTTGTWATDNSSGMFLSFGIGVGSSFSTTAGSWNAGTFLSATGATSVVGANGATFYITGVQLEVGTIATGFEYRQYGTELALCQRYYEILSPCGFIGNSYIAGLEVGNYISYATTKRAIPTVAVINTAENVNVSTPNLGVVGVSGFRFWTNVLAAGGCYYTCTVTANAEL